MPYYSYITSFAVDDSSASTISEYSRSANFGGTPPATFSEYGTATPEGTSHYRDGFYTYIHTTSVNIIGPSLTYDIDQSGQNNLFYYYTYKESIRQNISTRTFSLSPFKSVFVAQTFSSYGTTIDYTNTTKSTIGSTSYTGDGGIYAGDILYLGETYTYTATIDRASTYSQSAQSYLYLDGVEWGSTTYPRIENSYVEFTYTFSSTRDYTGSFYLAPKNITLSANLEFLLDDDDAGAYVYQSPMLRAFFLTKNDILISDCDAVLNQTMSTSFTIAGLERLTGVYSPSSPQTIYLTTNSIGYSETSTTRTLYSYNFISTKQDETLYYLSSYTQNESFLSFFPVSGTFTYSYGGLASSGYNSAYSHSQTITIQTTTSIIDISCNIFSTFSLLKSLTISTTATSIVANQVFVGASTSSNEGSTYYANPSFFPISLYMAYSGFLSSSTQEILLGNFIKNVTDKTAYDNVNSDACAGIFRFTANGSRQGESDGSYYSNVPYGAKYHSYHNCTEFLYRDPLTSSIENVTINQNVSSFYGTSSGTSISQTINWMSGALNSSTSRSFEILYTDSRGTSSWTFDRVQDNDEEYFNYTYGGGGFFTGFPAVGIGPENIFATYGQGKNANYMANGAYFKSNSSAFEFVTTTYPNPISLENYDNYYIITENYSRISVFTTDFNFNQPLLMNISLRELY